MVSSSLSFDATLITLLVPLVCSASVDLLNEGEELLPQLAARLREAQAPLLFSVTPAHLEGLSAFLGDGKISDVAHIFNLGGEQLRTDVLWPFVAGLVPNGVYVNEYGPTEAVVGVTTEFIAGQSDAEGVKNTVNVPIGRPIGNTVVHIVDGHDQLQPIGVAGELLIGGVQVARGYLDREALTAERFVELELDGVPGRYYRTGDLARWRSDGRLEYLGRIDDQVKLRGYRIELGEIEACLGSHEGVSHAAVGLYGEGDGKRLVGYVVPVAGGMDDGELKDHLRVRLPDYMVPSQFVELEALPLTPNGKLDRKALPEPGVIEGAAYVAPRTQAERSLAAIWADVLGRGPESISIHDNFFALGGDSILSIRVIAKARQAGLGLEARDIFEQQTLERLALASQVPAETTADQGLASGSAPLGPIQLRYFGEGRQHVHHYNQSVLLTVPASVDEQALQRSVEMLLSHHDALRLRYERDEAGVWQQGYGGLPEEVPFHVERVPDLGSGLEVRATHWQASLDLSSGPLMRLVLFRCGAEARLLWFIHHLAVDGVSWRILLEDLEVCYESFVRGDRASLPEKSHGFGKWTARLEDWSRSEGFEAEAGYWRALEAVGSGLPVTGEWTGERSSYEVELSVPETRSLLEEVPSAYRTGINDILLTALLLALRDWTGRDRHLIDLESHGRASLFDDIDLSRTVGWFTSLYSVALVLPGDVAGAGADLGSCLKGVKEQLRSVPHDGIGYGILKYLSGEGLPGGDILFNYLGQFDASLREGGLFGVASGKGGETSGDQVEDHLLDIGGMVVEGCLRLSIRYDAGQFDDAGLAHFGGLYRRYLLSLIAHAGDHYGYSPSDFPLAMVDQVELDSLQSVYGRHISDLYPMTPLQQGLLYHSLHDAGADPYFYHKVLRLEGNVDPELFRRAFGYLVERHDTLRTVFLHEGSGFYQLVLDDLPPLFEVYDWREERGGDDKLDGLIRETKAARLAYDAQTLSKVQLVRLGEQDWRLVWYSHHLQTDGWSGAIVNGELLQACSLLAAGRQPEEGLGPVVPYRRYMSWLASQDKAEAEAYWRAKFEGSGNTGGLSFLRPAAPDVAPDYRRHGFEIEAGLFAKAKKFVQEHHVTLSTLVQLVWGQPVGALFE